MLATVKFLNKKQLTFRNYKFSLLHKDRNPEVRFKKIILYYFTKKKE